MVPGRVPDRSRIQIPKQAVISLSFLVFGDSKPINQNSKYVAGILWAYNIQHGEINQGRIKTSEARRGKCNFRLRLCVTSGRSHPKGFPPQFSHPSSGPLAGPRATVAKAAGIERDRREHK
jgi:hypothetical protein